MRIAARRLGWPTPTQPKRETTPAQAGVVPKQLAAVPPRRYGAEIVGDTPFLHLNFFLPLFFLMVTFLATATY
jgi:hypothetical protein